MIFKPAALALALAVSSLSAATAYAQDTPKPGAFLLELNKVAMDNANCYFSFVMQNKSTTSLKAISYTLSLFDQNGQLATQTVLSILPMAVGQVRTKIFGLPLTCASTSGIVAETAECTDASDAPSTVCDEAIFRSKDEKVQFPWQPQID